MRVAATGQEGLPEEDLWGKSRFYLGTGYRPGGALSRGFVHSVPISKGEGPDTYVDGYRWHLTEAGCDHIGRHLAAYRARYPAVDTGGLVHCLPPQ
ncbi:hypothetical protein ACWCQL_32950 [Streptomyces sp. NPDC002073]